MGPDALGKAARPTPLRLGSKLPSLRCPSPEGEGLAFSYGCNRSISDSASYDPPGRAAMGRWQRGALTEGPWRNPCRPSPLASRAVPLPIAARQGGSRGEGR